MVKFLCCSDTHGLPPPPLPEEGASAWLHAGDFYNEVVTCGRDCHVQGEPERSLKKGNCLDELKSWVKRCRLPIYAVAGNHDCVDPYHVGVDKGASLTKIEEGLFLVSIGWHGERYYDLPLDRDLQVLCTDAMNLVIRRTMPKDKFIVLTHWPACLPSYGSPREGYLSRVMFQFCKELKPLAAVEGHIDGLFGTKEVVDGTLYVVAGPAGGILSVNQTGEASYEEGPAGIIADYFLWRAGNRSRQKT